MIFYPGSKVSFPTETFGCFVFCFCSEFLGSPKCNFKCFCRSLLLQPEDLQLKAIWDTGATGSVITKNVAHKLALTPTGLAQLHTANGLATQNTYTIDIGLLNSVIIGGIIATEVDALTGGCDALIGMDVITLPDPWKFLIFSEMNFIPSLAFVEFLHNLTQKVICFLHYHRYGYSRNSKLDLRHY